MPHESDVRWTTGGSPQFVQDALPRQSCGCISSYSLMHRRAHANTILTLFAAKTEKFRANCFQLRRADAICLRQNPFQLDIYGPLTEIGSFGGIKGLFTSSPKPKLTRVVEQCVKICQSCIFLCLFAFALENSSRTPRSLRGRLASYCQLVEHQRSRSRTATKWKKCMERQFVCFDCANHCNVNRTNDVYKHIDLARVSKTLSNRMKLNIHGNNFSGCFRWRAILEKRFVPCWMEIPARCYWFSAFALAAADLMRFLWSGFSNPFNP